jgi:hypothetical protein
LIFVFEKTKDTGRVAQWQLAIRRWCWSPALRRSPRN